MITERPEAGELETIATILPHSGHGQICHILVSDERHKNLQPAVRPGSLGTLRCRRSGRPGRPTPRASGWGNPLSPGRRWTSTGAAGKSWIVRQHQHLPLLPAPAAGTRGPTSDEPASTEPGWADGNG